MSASPGRYGRRTRSGEAAGGGSPKKEDTASNQCSVTLVTTNPDLPMDNTGKVYHLDCHKDDIADNIIIVGDPGRVPKVATFFDKESIRFDNLHREIRIMTGTYFGVPVSALSTGMGTDNVEIVVNELHILKDYDFKNNKWPTGCAPLRIIRVGTCGSPNPEAEVGMLAIASHVLGMDNTCMYYKRPPLEGTVKQLQAAVDATELGKATHPYAGEASAELCQELQTALSKVNPKRKALVGVTASGSGFYGCQGRQVGKLELAVPTLLDDLASIKVPGAGVAGNNNGDLSVVNIEMECSSLCVLSSLIGYRASAVCVIVATRIGEKRTFAAPDVVAAALDDALKTALMAVTKGCNKK